MKVSQISVNLINLNIYISQLNKLEKKIRNSQIKSEIKNSKGDIVVDLSETVKLCNELGNNMCQLISNTSKALQYAKNEMESKDKALAEKWMK